MDLVTSVPRMSKEEFESILNSNMQVYITFNLTLPSLPSLVKRKKKTLTRKTCTHVSLSAYATHRCRQIESFFGENDPVLEG